MTPLETELRERIALDGPIPIAEFMTLCLTHTIHGYYTSNHPVGGRGSADRRGGDFITAPEVSQMFGEMIGVWCMQVWEDMGSPNRFNLVEIGPGRGTLMKDLLRVSKALPQFRVAAQIHLIEISPTLAEQQSMTLECEMPIVWLSDIDGLPDAPTLIIANELLDALPFRQWVKIEEDWHERAVGLVDGKLDFVVRPNRLNANELPAHHGDEPRGSVFETAPAREAFVVRVAERIAAQSGAALFIDYGHTRSDFGNTFQAMRDHAFAPVLNDPGKADLTSHVNFEPLLNVARTTGCVVPDCVSQGDFLLNLGLLERAGQLGAEQDKTVQRVLQTAVNRLVGPQDMGTLFKVFGILGPSNARHSLPGFQK